MVLFLSLKQAYKIGAEEAGWYICLENETIGPYATKKQANKALKEKNHGTVH